MSKKALYLIPTGYTRRLPLAYDLCYCKRDMRYRWCKNHEDCIVTFEMLEKCNHYIDMKSHNRSFTCHEGFIKHLYAPNGHIAYLFYRELCNLKK